MKLEFNLKDLGTFEIEDSDHAEFERLRIIIEELFGQLMMNVISNLAFVSSKEFENATSVVFNHGLGTKKVNVTTKFDLDEGEKIQEPGDTEIIDEDTVSVSFGSRPVSGTLIVIGQLSDNNIDIVTKY
jgi:hypothetical protein